MTGTVVWVVDGDTIHVRIGTRVEKVRYIGVNTPEVPYEARWWQHGGEQARAVNHALVAKRSVRLVKYQEVFRALQREAREAGRGLWSGA
jgi:endonuclease YncB( thermonuclease family)